MVNRCAGYTGLDQLDPPTVHDAIVRRGSDGHGPAKVMGDAKTHTTDTTRHLGTPDPLTPRWATPEETRMRLRRASWPPLLAALAVSLIAVACSSSSTTASSSTAAGSSPSGSPITVAFVTSLTGPGSPEFTTAPAGFYARLDQQNAEGGVNGHKLVPLVIDDQTSPTTVVTGVQDALSKGAFGIVSDSALFFLAAKYPQQQGVPVTGGFFDGPEWGQQPYTNMFAADNGSVDPKYPVNSGFGHFIKQHGGTVLCSYGYGISPSSTRSAVGTADSFTRAGGKVGQLDTSIPFGSVAMTTVALVAKQKGCDTFYAGLDDNSNFALAAALKEAGVKPKVMVFPTGFESQLVHSPSWGAVQGGYFVSVFRPFQLPNAGTQNMQ